MLSDDDDPFEADLPALPLPLVHSDSEVDPFEEALPALLVPSLPLDADPFEADMPALPVVLSEPTDDLDPFEEDLPDLPPLPVPSGAMTVGVDLHALPLPSPSDLDPFEDESFDDDDDVEGEDAIDGSSSSYDDVGSNAQKFSYGKPGERTAAQHMALTAKMREKRAQNMLERMKTMQVQAVCGFIEHINAAATLNAGTQLHMQRSSAHDCGIRLVIRRTGERVHKRLFSWSTMLALAFNPVRAVNVLASFYRCSARTVRRVQCAVAHAYLQTHVIVYGMILAELALTKPFFAVTDVMWDETAERLQIGGVKDGLSVGQKTSAWDVMVSKMSFTWGWLHHRDWKVMSFHVVCPPNLVISPASQHLWHAFNHSNSLAPIMNFRRSLLQLAEIAIEFKECDGASGNDKLIAHWVKDPAEPQQLLSQTVLCRNHRLQLGVVHLVHTIGFFIKNNLTLLADFYAACLFFGMGNHFLRLVTACRQAVVSHFKIRRGPPPQHEASFNDELKSYLLDNYPYGRAMGATKHHGRLKDLESSQGFRQYRADLECFFGAFNGHEFGVH